MSLSSYSFWRRSNYFKAVERLQFFTRVELFFKNSFARLVCHVHTLLIGTDLSTIFFKVKGLDQYTSWKVCVPDCFSGKM